MPNGEIKAKHGTSKVNFAGSKPIPGFQIRYIKFIDTAWADRLTVPVLPFSALDEAGARMYKGKKLQAQEV